MKQVADKISVAIGRPVEYVNVPPDAAREAAASSGMPEWLVEDMLWYYNYFSQRIGSQVTPIVEKVTGKEPITFDEWLKKHADAFK
jgi:hypothetical protein